MTPLVYKKHPFYIQQIATFLVITDLPHYTDLLCAVHILGCIRLDSVFISLFQVDKV